MGTSGSKQNKQKSKSKVPPSGHVTLPVTYCLSSSSGRSPSAPPQKPQITPLTMSNEDLEGDSSDIRAVNDKETSASNNHKSNNNNNNSGNLKNVMSFSGRDMTLTTSVQPEYVSTSLENNSRPPLSPHAGSRPSSQVPTYRSDLLTNSPTTPMLRSYRLHALSSQDSGTFLGSPLSNRSTSPIHMRFLEINGYPAGLENSGNTCYCNAVLQLLYHCSPLRLRLLELDAIYAEGKGHTGFESDTLLAVVADLFAKMHKANNQKKQKRNVLAPKAVIACIKKLNLTFNNTRQQDAHEFAMFLLSSMVETETRMMGDERNRALFFSPKNTKPFKFSSIWRKGQKETSPLGSTELLDLQGDGVELPPALRAASRRLGGVESSEADSGDGAPVRRSTTIPEAAAAAAVPDARPADRSTVSPLQEIFGGQFVSLTACFECERVTMMREMFLDLSLDVEQGSSLRRCVANFGSPELFHGNNKLYCDYCKKHVVAQKLIRVHRLPEYALLLHLKRFEYNEKTRGMTKRSDHVALPSEIDVQEYEPVNDENNSGTEPCDESHAHDASLSYEPSSMAVESTAEVEADGSDKLPRPSARLMSKLEGAVRRKGRFALNGFVAHVGEGPELGHYITCVRHGGRWCLFDDTTVTELTEREMQQYWGVPIHVSGLVTATAYILLYERVA